MIRAKCYFCGIRPEPDVFVQLTNEEFKPICLLCLFDFRNCIDKVIVFYKRKKWITIHNWKLKKIAMEEFVKKYLS